MAIRPVADQLQRRGEHCDRSGLRPPGTDQVWGTQQQNAGASQEGPSPYDPHRNRLGPYPLLSRSPRVKPGEKTEREVPGRASMRRQDQGVVLQQILHIELAGTLEIDRGASVWAADLERGLGAMSKAPIIRA